MHINRCRGHTSIRVKIIHLDQKGKNVSKSFCMCCFVCLIRSFLIYTCACTFRFMRGCKSYIHWIIWTCNTVYRFWLIVSIYCSLEDVPIGKLLYWYKLTIIHSKKIVGRRFVKQQTWTQNTLSIHFSTHPFASLVLIPAENGILSPLQLTMAFASNSSSNSIEWMPGKIWLTNFWTIVGSRVSLNNANTSRFDRKNNLEI